MTLSYPDAARRHLTDAKHLHDAGRLANADHLYGVAAECALKAVLQGLGMRIDPRREAPETRLHARHADVIWPVAIASMGERVAARWLPLLGDGLPFDDWSVNRRYDSDSTQPEKEAVEGHREAAGRARNVMDAAWLDGIAG